jgi:hypothetical protein
MVDRPLQGRAVTAGPHRFFLIGEAHLFPGHSGGPQQRLGRVLRKFRCDRNGARRLRPSQSGRAACGRDDTAAQSRLAITNTTKSGMWPEYYSQKPKSVSKLS